MQFHCDGLVNSVPTDIDHVRGLVGRRGNQERHLVNGSVKLAELIQYRVDGCHPFPTSSIPSTVEVVAVFSGLG